MNPDNSDICQSEWEIVQTEEATQTSNLSIDRVLKPDKPRLPLPRNLYTVDKSANTSYKSSITVFEFCQVIENPDEPEDIRNDFKVKGTPDDLRRSPADGTSTLSDRSEITSNICKDVIKPFLKPDCPEFEEEILNNAIDSVSEDFPDYQPCDFPDSDTERIRACLSLGKLDVCTSVSTNKSSMKNGPVEPASISEDTKIEVEISRVPLSCLVDAQALSPTETEEKAVSPVKKTCSCSQIDTCIKPVMEICHGDDTKEKLEDKNVCQEKQKNSCVCVTVTTSSKTTCAEKKSKESINKESVSKPDCFNKSSEEPNKESIKETNNKPNREPNKEPSKESNKESHSKLDCFNKTSEESIKKPNKEPYRESNKEPKKESELDCFKKTSKESNKEPNSEPNKESPSKPNDLKKASKESIKEPNKKSTIKPDCSKKSSKESIAKIPIECQNSLRPNVVVSSPEKYIDEDGPTIEGFVDALDTHTKTLTTIKVAMQDFVGNFCSSNQASDKESESPKRASILQRVFDVSDVDKNSLVPKISNVIKNMKLKVDSTLSMISDSIDNMATEGLKAPVHSNRALDNGETPDVGNNAPPAPVTMPTPVPVSNSMFYTIKDKIVSMFREPKSDISTRTSTFTNSSLESTNEADSSKAGH